MEERRGINRVDYRVKSVIVTCDTFEKFYVDAINVSPLGMDCWHRQVHQILLADRLLS